MGTSAHYLSARRRDGRDECVQCDDAGRVYGHVALPARGHSFAVAANGRTVVFGRQPGFFAWALDAQDQGASLSTQALALPAEHHFYGHGVYAPDGNTLYATENDYEHARGVIGVYDAQRGYARVGAFDSGGVGPHELLLMPDGDTLVVANGGIQTHPDYGKTVLNAATMAPALTYIDRHSGRVREHHTLESVLPDTWRHLSLRHLALDGAGTVWLGAQYIQPDGTRPPLMWCHRRGQDLHAAPCPESDLRAMRNYIGSVAASADGRVVAASSPVGGRVLFWDTTRSAFLRAVELADVCGLAPWDAQGFLLSSGYGALAVVDPRSPGDAVSIQHPAAQGLAWDNHLRAWRNTNACSTECFRT